MGFVWQKNHTGFKVGKNRKYDEQRISFEKNLLVFENLVHKNEKSEKIPLVAGRCAVKPADFDYEDTVRTFFDAVDFMVYVYVCNRKILFSFCFPVSQSTSGFSSFLEMYSFRPQKIRIFGFFDVAHF